MNARSTFTHRYTSLTSLISNVLINCVPQSLLCFFYSGCGGRGLCILLSDWLEGLGIALRIGSDWNWILIHCMKCVTLINLNPPSVKKCLWNMLAAVPLRLVYVNALLWLVNISMLVSTMLMSIWCDVIIVMISEPINGAANVTNIQTLFISKERGQNIFPRCFECTENRTEGRWCHQDNDVTVWDSAFSKQKRLLLFHLTPVLKPILGFFILPKAHTALRVTKLD